eukprot:gene14082-18897_t
MTEFYEKGNRVSFTPGWNNEAVYKEILPIKHEGKLIRRKKIREEVSGDAIDQNEIIIDDEDNDEGNVSIGKISKKRKHNDDAKSDKSNQPINESNDTEEIKNIRQKIKKIDQSSKSKLTLKSKSASEINYFQSYIGKLCTSILANPQACFKPKSSSKSLKISTKNESKSKQNNRQDEADDRNNDDGNDEENSSNNSNISELFSFLTNNDEDPIIIELVMLSLLLLFKDICPTYRIRIPDNNNDDNEAEAKLKKETKQLLDYELSLVKAYKRFINLLNDKILLYLHPTTQLTSVALNNNNAAINQILVKNCQNYNNNSDNQWNDVESKLGLSALRCQCELLIHLSHFNYRNLLINSIVSHAIVNNQNNSTSFILTANYNPISSLCCDTLQAVFKQDNNSEISYEIITIISKLLAITKYSNIPIRFLKCLEFVKLNVHADAGADIRKKAKSERKKRKKTRDEVEIGLLESNTKVDELNKKRFQADCLKEVCLIYFRIVKMKVGFSLLPTALEGLSRITHLINIDTVEDLVYLMRGIVESNPPPPPLIQLRCIHCSLQTLSGPGQELKIDEELFINKLTLLMNDIPLQFPRWDIILECLELCLIKKREERNFIVIRFVRLLLLSVPHVFMTPIMTSLCSMAHKILLKYPRARQAMEVLLLTTLNNSANGNRDIIRDDEVCDLAMKPLKDEAYSGNNNRA